MFETLLVQPIYNLFIALVGLMPHGDAGLAIVALTILMRIVLYPIFTSQIRMQMGMAAMQPELEGLKEKHKGNKEALAREQMALFKKYKVNPLAGFGALFLQLAVVIGLYFALFRETFPAVDTGLLYSFVPVPPQVAIDFFGLINIAEPRHILLALIVGLTQYLAIRLTVLRTPNPHAPGSDKATVHNMQQNLMLYFLPLVVMVSSYFLAAAVGIYFTVSNLFSLVQELIVRRQLQKQN
jgi:YidC/Oxa1 family membrane protein insertase